MVKTMFGVRIDGKVFHTLHATMDVEKAPSKTNPNRACILVSGKDFSFSVSIHESSLKKGKWIVEIETDNPNKVEVEVKKADIVF